MTFHQNDNTYSIFLRFDGTPEVSSVTVSGPPGSGISNAPLYDDGQHIDEGPNDGIFSNHLFYLPARPNVGDD
ncbi:MAG: choice-of-anchor X domain-containing protein, partial [Candidatus Thorarchaeota archaeon]